MIVTPNETYKLLGTNIHIVKGEEYHAEHATNQPDWEKKGLIFVNDILLESGEYEIVR